MWEPAESKRPRQEDHGHLISTLVSLLEQQAGEHGYTGLEREGEEQRGELDALVTLLYHLASG